jgi:1,4-alpha-glucan branching enzyme
MGNANSTDSLDLSKVKVPKIDELLKADPYLTPYEPEITRRYGCFQQYLHKINNYENGLLKFTESYKTFGIQVDEKNNITILEWAPAAKNIYFRGDFSKLTCFGIIKDLFI